MNATPSENDLRSLLSEGQTLYTISRKFNTTAKEVFELGRSYGISFAYDHNHIPRPTKQDLESMYTDEGMTQHQIGKEFGVVQQSVYRWISDYNIPTRGSNGTIETVPPKEVIEKMYYEDGMTQYQIGKYFGVTRRAVGAWFSKYGIQVRVLKIPEKEVIQRMYNDEGMTQRQIGKEFGVSHGVIWNCIHIYDISTVGRQGSLIPLPSKDELLNYIAEGLNQHQIAEEYEVCDATIFKWCEYYGIPGMVNCFRCMTPEHIKWRSDVFERDHRTCQKCGATNTPIQAHHIVPYCDHPEVGYELENGITLCKQCHESIRWHEYEYIDQFAAITQSHLRDHEVIESMPWEATLPPLSDKLFPDYSQEVIPCLD